MFLRPLDRGCMNTMRLVESTAQRSTAEQSRGKRGDESFHSFCSAISFSFLLLLLLPFFPIFWVGSHELLNSLFLCRSSFILAGLPIWVFFSQPQHLVPFPPRRARFVHATHTYVLAYFTRSKQNRAEQTMHLALTWHCHAHLQRYVYRFARMYGTCRTGTRRESPGLMEPLGVSENCWSLHWVHSHFPVNFLSISTSIPIPPAGCTSSLFRHMYHIAMRYIVLYLPDPVSTFPLHSIRQAINPHP